MKEIQMRRLLVPSAVLLVATIVAPAAAAELESGVQVGKPVKAFNVRDCTGPSKNTTLCYR